MCECGCGQRVPLAGKTDARRGYRKGEPVRFLPGHHRRFDQPPVDKIDFGYETPCLVWVGAVNSKGYPTRSDGQGSSYLVHRRALEEHLGRPLAADDDAHHRCGQRRCVRGDHLQALTRTEHNREHARIRRVA